MAGALRQVRWPRQVPSSSGRRSLMTKSLKWTAALLALGLGAGGCLEAGPTGQSQQQPTQQELMQQLNDLKAKVAAMEQNQANQANALAKYDSRDVDATVAAVLKDAHSHSLLVDS